MKESLEIEEKEKKMKEDNKKEIERKRKQEIRVTIESGRRSKKSRRS